MNITFQKQVLVNRKYDITIDQFMNEHFEEASLDWQNSEMVLLYVRTSCGHNIQFVKEIPYIDGLDIENKDDIKTMLEAHYTKELS